MRAGVLWDKPWAHQSWVWALRGVDGMDRVKSWGSHCHQKAPDMLTCHISPLS